MSDWSQELQLQFLEVFQGEPVIWDPKHGSHKDKKRVTDAWGRIEIQIGKPIKELKCKKDSLMATYRGYCRKIAASINSGASAEDAYKPVWFAFDFMDQFLGSVYNCRTTANTKEVPSISKSTKSEDIPTNNGSEKGELQQDRDLVNYSSITRKAIRRRADLPELKDAAKQMKNALNALTTVLNKKEDVEDECDMFGKLIAKRLKKLSDEDKEDVMFEIERLFYSKIVQSRDASNNASSSLTPPFTVHKMSPSSEFT